MTNVNQLNPEEIKRVAERNDTSKALFALFSQRERNARDGISTLPVVYSDLREKGYKAIKSEIKKTFQELENIGVGKLKGERFQWGFGLRDVAATAVAAVPPTRNRHRSNDAPARSGKSRGPSETAASKAQGVVTNTCFSVVLGSGRMATISIPVDLTKEEGQRLISLLE